MEKYVINIIIMKKQINIVMPTYNQGKFIKEALDSIFSQTYHNFQLIVVDDMSTDNSWKILCEYFDARKNESEPPYLHILKNPNGNKGTGNALNEGFKFAKEINNDASYETWFPSDNRMKPTLLEDLSNYLDRHPNIDVVYGGTEIGQMDETGLREVEHHDIKREVGDQKFNPFTVFENFNLGVCWMWRKEARLKAGELYMEKPCEDYEMLMRMILTGAKFGHLDKILVWHRRHQESMSNKLNRENHGKYVAGLVKEMCAKRDLFLKSGGKFANSF